MWQISGNIIQEVWLKNSVVLEKRPPLNITLNVSEMHVVPQIKAFVTAETSEGNVALYLVSISHAEGSIGHDLAVILDSHDYVEQTVFLDETAVDFSLIRILRRSVIKGIAIFLGDRLGRISNIGVGFIFNSDIDEVAVTYKGLKNVVVLQIVLLVHVSERAEDEVSLAGEEERFRGELVLLGVRYSHSDVVVSAEATHTAPKLQLFKF